MDPHKDTWNEDDKLQWLAKQSFQRSYDEQVLARVDKLRDLNVDFKVEHYGNLSLQARDNLVTKELTFTSEEYEARYPLYYIQVGDIGDEKPSVIVTGGTHGYEESGVYAALEFLEHEVSKYTERFNFIVFPCVSPFAYEVNQRWTHDAWDPNRSFDRSKPYVPEAQLVMDVLDKVYKQADKKFAVAIDLHETPDRDKIMMPPQYQRYGIDLKSEDIQIPNGYYLIADAANDSLEMAKHIVETVRKVTPIAPEADIHGEKNDAGVVVSEVIDPIYKGLNQSYMKTLSNNAFTTEIYPEIHPEPKGSKEAIAAQKATVLGALDYLSQKFVD